MSRLGLFRLEESVIFGREAARRGYCLGQAPVRFPGGVAERLIAPVLKFEFKILD